MIKFVQYEPEHLRQMGYDPEIMMLDDENMPAYSAMGNDKVIACGGVRTSTGGLAEAWFIHGNRFEQNYIYVCKNLKKLLNELIEKSGAKAVTATYDIDNEVHKRFIEWMGFTKPIGIYYHLDGPYKGKIFMVVMKP